MFLFEYIYFLIVTRDSGKKPSASSRLSNLRPSDYKFGYTAVFIRSPSLRNRGKNHDKCVLMFKKSQIKFLLSKEFCRILFQLITSNRTSTNDAPQAFVEKHCNKKHINLTEEKSITKCVYIHVKGDEESHSHIIKGTFRTDCTHPRNYDFHYDKHKVE